MQFCKCTAANTMQSAVHCKAWLMFGIYSHYEQVVVLVAPHITFHYIVIHCITLHYNGIYSHYSQVVVLLAPHRVGMHCHLPQPTRRYLESGAWVLLLIFSLPSICRYYLSISTAIESSTFTTSGIWEGYFYLPPCAVV